MMIDRPIRTAARRRRVIPPRPARSRRPPPARRAARSPAARRRALGADTSRPPWRATMSVAIASPRPRRPAAGARPAGELGNRRRQPAALVGDLDPHAPGDRARADLDGPRSVLERVGEQVADRLREPDAVAAHEGVRRRRRDPQLAAEHRRDRLPRRRLVGDQRARRRRRRRGRAARRPARAAARSSRARPARRSSSSIAASRALAPGSAWRAPACRARCAAVSGPRSSWQARATSSRPRRSSRHAIAASASAVAATAQAERGAHAGTPSTSR